MTTLITDRLILRPPTEQDIDTITSILQDPRVSENLASVPWPYHREYAAEWMATLPARAAAQGSPGVFAITWRESGEFIGTISLNLDEQRQWGVFGYWLGIDYWGRGIMTEALQEILRHGFEDLGLRRIEACHFAHNPASGRVMEKAGLRREGVQRLRARRFDQLHDRVLYGIIDDEWRAARPATI